MFNTFNMGIGMVLAVDRRSADDALKYQVLDYNVYVIGEVIKGETGVDICSKKE